jgi:hypothetical protein
MYTVEAKAQWLGPRQDIANDLKRFLEEAHDQLKQLDKEYRWGRAMAICYVVPMRPVQENPTMKDLAEDFEQLPRQILKSLSNYDLIIASYRHPGDAPVDDGNYHPGVLLVGALVSW